MPWFWVFLLRRANRRNCLEAVCPGSGFFLLRRANRRNCLEAFCPGSGFFLLPRASRRNCLEALCPGSGFFLFVEKLSGSILPCARCARQCAALRVVGFSCCDVLTGETVWKYFPLCAALPVVGFSCCDVLFNFDHAWVLLGPVLIVMLRNS